MVVADVISTAAAIIVVGINTIRVILGLTKARSSTISEVCVCLHGAWLLMYLSPHSLPSAVAPTGLDYIDGKTNTTQIV